MKDQTERLIYDEGPVEAAAKIRRNFPARITIMFAPHNFLYTDCRELLSRMYNIMVVEQTERAFMSRPMFYSNYNCGYLGAGPAKTEELLLNLGLEPELAEELACYCNGFQISFDKDGRLIDSATKKGFPLEIRTKQHIKSGETFFVDTEMLVADYIERNLTFLDISDSADFTALLNTLSSLEPDYFDYYIGRDNKKELALPYKPLELERREKTRPGYTREKLDGSFVRFHGKSFDVTAFINEDAAVSTINVLSSLFAGHELFEEKRIGRYGVFLREAYKRSKEGMSGRVLISKDFIRSRKWFMFR